MRPYASEILRRIPWFVAAPTLLAATIIIALLIASQVGPYFERVRADEPDPLASAGGNPPSASTPPAAAPTATGRRG